MGGVHDVLEGFGIEAGGVGRKRHLEPEALAIVALSEADIGRDGCFSRKFYPRLSGGKAHGAQKAGGIAGGEKLLGIGALAARSAHFPRRGEVHIDLAVIGFRVSVLAATAAGGCVSGVKNFHDAFPSRNRSRGLTRQDASGSAGKISALS